MCTKRRFATRAGALLRIAEIKRKGDVREKTPTREYYCRICGGYHLTSQKMSDKKRKKIIERKKYKPEKIANEWIKKNRW